MFLAPHNGICFSSYRVFGWSNLGLQCESWILSLSRPISGASTFVHTQGTASGLISGERRHFTSPPDWVC
jgi:hypothetical protein